MLRGTHRQRCMLKNPGQRTFFPLTLYGEAAGRFRPTSQPTSPRPCSRYQRPAVLARKSQQHQHQHQQCRHHRRRLSKMSPDPQRGLPTTPYQGSGGRGTTTEVCRSARKSHRGGWTKHAQRVKRRRNDYHRSFFKRFPTSRYFILSLEYFLLKASVGVKPT